MDALQTSAAALGLFYSRRTLNDPQYIFEAVVRLLAKIPTMVAAFALMRKGNDSIQPNDDLDYSTNFLYMLTERVPDTIAARLFDICLILHAEHTINGKYAMVTSSDSINIHNLDFNDRYATFINHHITFQRNLQQHYTLSTTWWSRLSSLETRKNRVCTSEKIVIPRNL